MSEKPRPPSEVAAALRNELLSYGRAEEAADTIDRLTRELSEAIHWKEKYDAKATEEYQRRKGLEYELSEARAERDEAMRQNALLRDQVRELQEQLAEWQCDQDRGMGHGVIQP